MFRAGWRCLELFRAGRRCCSFGLVPIGDFDITRRYATRREMSLWFKIPPRGEVLSLWNISGRSTLGVWVSKQKMRKYPRVLTQGFLGQIQKNQFFFAPMLSLNLPEDDREAWNQTKLT